MTDTKQDTKKRQPRTEAGQAAMLEALEKTLGVVTTACNMTGIARSKHYRWLKSDPEYAEAVRGISDIALDFAESNLLKLMKSNSAGAVTANIFYLKTKGKHRGYVERQEIKAELTELDQVREFRRFFVDGNTDTT
jgi:hypothetical protein